MSAQNSFWQRVGNLLRGDRSNGNGVSDADVATLEADNPDAPKSPADESLTQAGPTRLLARWGRRRPNVAQMREGYQRVSQLMDALEDHFQKQDQRAEVLGHSVERIAGILDQLADSGRTQQEHVRTIAENVGEAGKHTAAMSVSLSQMPRALQLQTEAVRSMLQQIEASQESDTRLKHSLQQLSQAVGALNSSSAAQVQTLERLHSSDNQQKEVLTALVREQSRRFVVIIVAAALLGLGALAALAVVLALRLSQ